MFVACCVVWRAVQSEEVAQTRLEGKCREFPIRRGISDPPGLAFARRIAGVGERGDAGAACVGGRGAVGVAASTEGATAPTSVDWRRGKR